MYHWKKTFFQVTTLTISISKWTNYLEMPLMRPSFFLYLKKLFKATKFPLCCTAAAVTHIFSNSLMDFCFLAPFSSVIPSLTLWRFQVIALELITLWNGCELPEPAAPLLFSEVIIDLLRYIQTWNDMKLLFHSARAMHLHLCHCCLLQPLSLASSSSLVNFHMNLDIQYPWPHWSSACHWQFSTCYWVLG